MRTLAFTIAMLSSAISFARPPAAFSLGPVISVPEIFGGQLSYWPDDDVSVDFRATLSSVEAGLTGHIALSNTKQGSLWNESAARHDILVTGLGGFVHRGVRAGTYSDGTYGSGGRFIGAAGYGYQGSIDLRIMGGLSAYEAAGWQLDPTFWVSLGFFI